MGGGGGFVGLARVATKRFKKLTNEFAAAGGSPANVV